MSGTVREGEFSNPSSEKVLWSLQYAAAHKQTNVVAMLVALVREVNELGSDGNRALDISSLNGDALTAKFLLEHGANPNLRNKAGSSPLHDAALKGTREVIELLIAHGAELNARERDGSATPLHYAASFGCLDAVKALVEQGADIKLKTGEGSTAFELAVENGFTEVAAYLNRAQPSR
jgi:ankyrin repeat protein